MKRTILALAGAILIAAPLAAFAGPKHDREELVHFFSSRYPNIKFNNYVYGSMAFNPDAKAQYDSIMEFPPFTPVIEKGKKMWEKPFKNGKTFASCFPNGGKNVAGDYPMFDNKLGKVVTFEMAINQCLKKNGEPQLSYSNMKTMGVLVSYARTLSDGMKMNIKVKGPGALAAYTRGKEFFYRRRGQLNFACATCHVDNAGKRLRSQILSTVVGQATHWPVFRGGTRLFTLQRRYVGCNKQVRAVPFKPGSEVYNDLEYFESYVSNGLPMHASVFRP
ncbi:MAG TPA: sulfur oxidation c-type cytochrome SoxA [Betaproteobacteria bacterium]|nr:sulfur oxidation c-type cytochrome SoxA [Betaproteobacteria bacterium]